MEYKARLAGMHRQKAHWEAGWLNCPILAKKALEVLRESDLGISQDESGSLYGTWTRQERVEGTGTDQACCLT